MGQQAAELNGMPSEPTSLSNENARHVYSKDFLLSVADLEYCRKLPPGIDPVVLRDAPPDLVDGGITIQALSSRGLIRRDRESDGLSESLPDVPEWRRPSGVSGSSLLQQGPRRSDLAVISSNSKPAWADNGPPRNNVERFGGPGSAGQGRWEYRSGPGDRERERNRPRRELDLSESGRSGWVAQEHDGLLGSGGPICTGGMMSSQSRTLDRHHASGRIGRSAGDLYYPARAGKVSSNSSREDSDYINDETFGSEDRSNEERSEKERQRRESFEQMRKEQQRHNKERLKSQYQNHVETRQPDSSKIADKKEEDSSVWDAVQSNEVLPSTSPGTPHSSSSKENALKVYNKEVAGTTSVLYTPRLLVPPGFSKAALQKSSSIKDSDPEGKAYLLNVDDGNLHVKQMDQVGTTGTDPNEGTDIIVAGKDQLSDKEDDDWSHTQAKTSKFASFFSTGEDSSQQRSLWTSEGSSAMPLLFKSENMASTSTTLDNHFDAVGNQHEGSGLAILLKPSLGSSDAGTVIQDLGLNESNSVTSHFPVNGKGGYSPSMPLGPSLEDVERVITASGNNAASGSPIKEPWATDNKRSNPLDVPFQSDPVALSGKSLFSEVLGLDVPFSKQVSQPKRQPVFLTCEDIEQSILAEVVQSSGKEAFVSEVEAQKDSPQSTFNFSQLLQSGSDKNRIDNTVYYGHFGNASQIDTDINASRHLMSLLQKGTKTAHSEQLSSPTSEDSYLAMLGQGTNHGEEREANCNAAEIQTQTLETLFGKAFVNELRSVGQPVSGKLLQDDSAHVDKEGCFQSFHESVSSSRQPNRRLPVASNDDKRLRGVQGGGNHFYIDSDYGVESSKECETFNLQHHGSLMGKNKQVSSLGTGVHNELGSNVSPHIASGKNYDNPYLSRGRSVGGSFSRDLGQPQMSAQLPHQRHLLYPSGDERSFLPSSSMPSQGLHFESMHGPQILHDNTPKGGRVNEHAQSSAFHPIQAGLFHQPGHHVQGQYGQHAGGQSSIVGGAYRMPSPYPSEFTGSAQMGFESSDHVGAPHSGGGAHNSPAVEKRFSGDSTRISQGIPGFSPYQHPVSAVMPERKVAYGNSDVGTGNGQTAGMGLPLDSWYSDMRLSAQNLLQGLNPNPRPPAITPDWKLGYG